MIGDIREQRNKIEQHLQDVEAEQGPAAAKKQRNVIEWIEGYFSENDIRKLYAVLLWGRSWKHSYDDCPSWHQAESENAPYEKAIITLASNWKDFKKGTISPALENYRETELDGDEEEFNQ